MLSGALSGATLGLRLAEWTLEARHMYGTFFLRLLTNHNVRFAPENGQIADIAARPFSATGLNRSRDNVPQRSAERWRSGTGAPCLDGAST